MSSSYWNGVLSQRLTRRRAMAATGATTLSAALLAACGGGSSSSLKVEDVGDGRKPGTVWQAKNDWKLADEAKIAVKGGIYRSVINADQAGHYDAMVLAPSQVPFSDHVHEYFMSRNRGVGVDPKSREANNNPVPALAESYEISADGAQATFTLRPNVKWHPVAPVNGRVMDIDDWRTSMERFLVSSPQSVPMKDTLAKLEFPDARTMVMKLNYPYAPLLARIWSERFAPVVMPKELNADPNLAQKVSIGTGYKILDKHQPSITMEYRKHTDYWGGEPFIDRWHVPIIPEYANRYAQFVNGNIIDFEPTARDISLIQKDAPGVVLVANDIADDNIIRIRFGRNNQKTLPWKDVRVRIAIRRSIDFRKISEFLANKQQFDALGFPVEVTPMTHLPHGAAYWLDPEKGELGKLSDNYIFSIAEAKKLMAAAGFDGPVNIDYTVLPEAGETPEQEKLVIDSLAATGTFKVNMIASRNTVEHRNCRSLGQCDGLVMSSVSEDADHIIYRDYHSMGNTEGEQAYPDPRIDRIAEAQRREMDYEKRMALLKDFQMLAAELMPAVPYRHLYTSFRARWPWLRNLASGYPSSTGVALPPGRPVLGGHKQWLDESMPNRDKRA